MFTVFEFVSVEYKIQIRRYFNKKYSDTYIYFGRSYLDENVFVTLIYSKLFTNNRLIVKLL